MTLQMAIRSMMAIGLGMAMLAGTAAAQEAPAVDKTPEKAVETKAAPVTPGSTVAEPATQQEKAVETKAAPITPASKAPQEDPAFQSWKDKLSYAVGADLARSLKGQTIDVNVDLLVRALKDGLAGNKLGMTDAEVTATLKRFEDERKLDYEHAKMMLSEKNKKAGEALFAENLKKEGVVTLPSGLQYKILKQGEGRKPTLDDIVVCNYRGTLLDGTEIDSSYKRKEPTAAPVKGLIPGWSQAIQMMPVGSKWQLFLAPQLAYGDKGTPIFGPNTTLIFEVELLSIVDKTQTVSAK